MVDAPDSGLPRTQPRGDSGSQPGEPGAGGGRLGNPAADDAPVGLRVGHNPGNLGDDVADAGDVTYPAPAPEAVPEI